MEADQWYPARRLQQYQRQKLFIGLLMASLFLGWMVFTSNRWIQSLAPVLGLSTIWIVTRSVMSDLRRSRGRQVVANRQGFTIVESDKMTRVPLGAIAMMRWRNEPSREAGLWLYGCDEKPLGHVGSVFLSDESEARDFLGWARRQTGVNFRVQWPRRTK